MTNSAFVIGLGGTGVSSVMQIKSQLLVREGQLPPNVRLLAFDTDPIRSQVVAGEDVALDTGEYAGLGGDLYELAQEISRGLHPHIGAWFQAETSLAVLPRDAFLLQRGSGHLRQFGRLALFRDLAAPSRSNIYSLIDHKIWEIIAGGTSRQLDVFLIAGLGGGSGGSILIDIAHLVREIAQTNHQLTPTIFAFLVLPNAYLGLSGTVSIEMHASAYAAVREIESVTRASLNRSGYQVQYRPGAGDSRIWRSRLSRPPLGSDLLSGWSPYCEPIDTRGTTIRYSANYRRHDRHDGDRQGTGSPTKPSPQLSDVLGRGYPRSGLGAGRQATRGSRGNICNHASDESHLRIAELSAGSRYPSADGSPNQSRPRRRSDRAGRGCEPGSRAWLIWTTTCFEFSPKRSGVVRSE